MFIANDSNYTFGKFLAVVSGDDIKAPVYSKCFTDTEALKGYRFIHDPEETDPEKCVCYSIYDDVSSEATSTAFGENAVVSDLTSVSFRLDTKILDAGKVRDVPYYHVIVPVQNIKDDTLKYLVIKMTKEVELFPENYPYYELVSTFADAEPTSAEAPGGGGGGDSDFTTATMTINNKSGEVVSNLSIPNIIENIPPEAQLPFTNVIMGVTDTIADDGTLTVKVPLYKGAFMTNVSGSYNVTGTFGLFVVNVVSGSAQANNSNLIVTGDCEIDISTGLH